MSRRACGLPAHPDAQQQIDDPRCGDDAAAQVVGDPAAAEHEDRQRQRKDEKPAQHPKERVAFSLRRSGASVRQFCVS